MLIYHQASGLLFNDGTPIGLCYAGNGPGLNNPLMQNKPNVGPLPQGRYTLRKVDSPHLGPIVFSLDPEATNEMFGRSAFYLHWDNAQANFSASEGCIVPVMPAVFQRVHDGDKLIVVA